MKRYLSLILALVLTVALIPSALAADSLSGFAEATPSDAELASAETLLHTLNAFKAAGYPSMDDPSAASNDTLVQYTCWNIQLDNIENVKKDSNYISYNGCIMLSAPYKVARDYMQKHYGVAPDLSSYEQTVMPSKSSLTDQVDIAGPDIALSKVFVFDGSLYSVQSSRAPALKTVKNCRFFSANSAGYLVSYDIFDEGGTLQKGSAYAVMKRIPGACQLVRVFDTLPSNDTVLSLLGIAPVTGDIIATRTTSPLLIDGRQAAIAAYNIKGSNYYKLRDLAHVLSGTNSRFSVGWNAAKKLITVTPGMAYAPVGGELTNPGIEDKVAQAATSTLICRGQTMNLTAYNIGGSTYYKLRDLGELFGFKVSWNESERIINVTTPQ